MVSTEPTFEMTFAPGVPPETVEGWPGMEYSSSVDLGMQIERNVTVPMRDGKLLRVDLYRPEHPTGPLPVLIAWSPYGKHGQLDWRYWPGNDVPVEELSPYTCFETPDPAYWAGQGYAVIMADARGAWGSEGNVTMFGPEEAEACYDLVEWAGTQDWSNGKVGMSGVSWYSSIQWLVAALNPPHLAAINPWEGFSDLYYEVAAHGGIPETAFTPMLAPLISFTHEMVEDVSALAMEHPYDDVYWASKRADLSAIRVPAFIVASWSDHGLHTRGTLEGYRRVSSAQKWLMIHGRKKWQNFYQQDNLRRQTRFFDQFLKGEHTEVETWAPVAVEVRESYYHGELRAENEWPLARTEYTPFFLDAAAGRLTEKPSEQQATATYHALTGSVTLSHTFSCDTEVTGYAKLRLWVEADGSDDMDLFVALQKIGADGQKVDFPFFSTFNDGNVALGWLRVSRRELDESASTLQQPKYAHRRDQPLAPGEIVPVDIEIWPSGTLFKAGETLRLVVQGHDVNRYADGLFAQRHDYLKNAGQHILHTGGRYDSHLLLPVIPAAD
jgi:uncharacterized protein